MLSSIIKLDITPNLKDRDLLTDMYRRLHIGKYHFFTTIANGINQHRISISNDSVTLSTVLWTKASFNGALMRGTNPDSMVSSNKTTGSQPENNQKLKIKDLKIHFQC